MEEKQVPLSLYFLKEMFGAQGMVTCSVEESCVQTPGANKRGGWLCSGDYKKPPWEGDTRRRICRAEETSEYHLLRSYRWGKRQAPRMIQGC